MNQLTEFFNSLKERLSSPLIFSFVMSWLCWNWEITVALLYRDAVAHSGYRNIFDFINCHLSPYKSILLPVISAFAYVLGFPYLKRKINVFIAVQTRKENDEIVESLRGGKVSTDKYLRIVDRY